MVVSLRNSKWVVISVDLEHNHELSPPDETKFLRSHKHMTDQEKLFIRTFNSVKLPTRKIMAILAYLRGGVGALPYTKKYVSNVRTAIRNECRQNDMTQVLEYFRKRKQADPRFFYDFKLGEGNKVLSLFWSDEHSRKMYELYGDCVSFDTTYKTNRYNLPFAPFVGVTGHGNNCLFACAFVQNETIDVFTWLFQTFRECMGNKDPTTIITDQCVSMGKAIPAVFPNIVHRFCFFHIRKEAEEKCGRSFATKIDLHADFSDILRNSLTVEEFELLWPQMIQRYDVGHLKYLKAMWDNRHRFVPVYFKKEFFPFIHSTARSDGTNSVFKDNLGSTYSVISFLSEYQRICEAIQEKEKEQDSITRTTIPSYHFHSEIEIQAGSVYNRQIFYKFQSQLKFTTKLHVDEKDGIVCSHILRVLVNLNISELPAKYFLDRWKPKERKTIRDRKFNLPMQLTEKDSHLRFSLLSDRLIDIASNGSKSNDRYLMVVEEAKKIQEKLDAMSIADEQEELLIKHESNQISRQALIFDDGYADILQNPDVAKPRGRPTTAGWHKTLAEQFRTKQKITCSHCGSHVHKYATCTSKHLPKSTFEKKNASKKASGSSAPKHKYSYRKTEQSKAKKMSKVQASPMEL